jgi:hypothetical protein
MGSPHWTRAIEARWVVSTLERAMGRALQLTGISAAIPSQSSAPNCEDSSQALSSACIEASLKFSGQTIRQAIISLGTWFALFQRHVLFFRGGVLYDTYRFWAAFTAFVVYVIGLKHHHVPSCPWNRVSHIRSFLPLGSSVPGTLIRK